LARIMWIDNDAIDSMKSRLQLKTIVTAPWSSQLGILDFSIVVSEKKSVLA